MGVLMKILQVKREYTKRCMNEPGKQMDRILELAGGTRDLRYIVSSGPLCFDFHYSYQRKIKRGRCLSQFNY